MTDLEALQSARLEDHGMPVHDVIISHSATQQPTADLEIRVLQRILHINPPSWAECETLFQQVKGL